MKHTVLLAAALVFCSAAYAQQNYPNRPLRMIVPWPPGQATDLVGRVMAQKMSEVLGQQIVIDNRAGAGGMIGTDVAAKATPDGYTLLAASSGPVSINPLLQKAAYDAERELAPVANVPGFDAAAWIGLMTTAGTPKAVIDRLAAAVETAMQSPEVLEKLLAVGVEVNYRRPDEFTRYLKDQQARYIDIIRTRNIKIE
jgi:tripartite-type tricarboxylate transporter receptor subunit TctC